MSFNVSLKTNTHKKKNLCKSAQKKLLFVNELDS